MLFELLFKLSRDMLLVLDGNGNIIEANEAATKAYGYTYEEMLALKICDLQAVVNGALLKAVHRRQDNSTFLVEVSQTAVEFNHQPVTLCIIRDISQQVRSEELLSVANEELVAANEELTATNEELIATEEELRKNYYELWKSRDELAVANKQLTDIIEFLPDATFILDKNKKVVAWNLAIEKMTGILKKDIIGHGDYAYSVPFHGSPQPGLVDLIEAEDSMHIQRYQNFDRQENSISAEFFSPLINHSTGAYLQIKTTILRDNKGHIAGAIETIRDITELRNLSIYDQVTQLYNRTYFEEELQRLETVVSDIGIIMIDYDGLKLINETFGHKAGDEMLAAVAKILAKSFCGQEKVFRIGGDEFAVLVPHCTNESMDKRLDKITANIELYNQQHIEQPLNISMGYSLRNNFNTPLSKIFKEADDSMYRSKLHRSMSSRSSIVHTLMKALEARDFITEGHADRLQFLVEQLGNAMGMPLSKLYDLRLFAQFHDIGKVGIPDRILFKPGPLTKSERKEMERHSEIGYRIAKTAPDLMPIADWVLKHHEWWNGSGYPLGLQGEEIPLECRILAIADAYDAMSNDRPYRKALPQQAIITELENFSGVQFDPQLVVIFKELVC